MIFYVKSDLINLYSTQSTLSHLQTSWARNDEGLPQSESDHRPSECPHTPAAQQSAIDKLHTTVALMESREDGSLISFLDASSMYFW